MLVDLAKAQNVKGQVGYVNRFNPIFNKVLSILNSGILGNITHYNNKMTGGVILNKNNGWRNNYELGGGCLFDYGPHCFDLATFLFGTEVKVASSNLKRIHSSDVDDVVFANLIHNDSVLGFNYINWSDNSVRKATNTIEIFGERGKIVANKQEINLYLSNVIDNDQDFTIGWNQLYITSENTDVEYYLRGEDFSLQLLEFSRLINSEINESRSNLFTASVVDRVLEEISLNNKLL